MMTSEAAIKAIIESVIKKSQQNHEPEQLTTGLSENLSQPSSSDLNLINGINLQGSESAQGDLANSPIEHNNSSLGADNAEREPCRMKSPQNGEKKENMGKLEEGEKGQIWKAEKKKTTIQVDIIIYFHVNLNKDEVIHRSQDQGAPDS